MTEKEREAELVRAKGKIDPNFSSAGITDIPLVIEKRTQGTEAYHPATGASSRSKPPTILISTDPPLKAAPKELIPLGASLLIQYDLPSQKVTWGLIIPGISKLLLLTMWGAYPQGKHLKS